MPLISAQWSGTCSADSGLELLGYPTVGTQAFLAPPYAGTEAEHGFQSPDPENQFPEVWNQNSLI